MKTYEAIYLPGGEDMSKKGFLTENEAWDYVESFNCETCKKDGSASMCAAEWMVDEEEI